MICTHHARVLGLYGDKLVEWRQMRRLVGRHWWTGVQDKMLTGDQWWKCLIGHRQVLHGAGLNELQTDRQTGREITDNKVSLTHKTHTHEESVWAFEY